MADDDLAEWFQSEYPSEALDLETTAQHIRCQATFEVIAIGEFKGRLQKRELWVNKDSMLSTEVSSVMTDGVASEPMSVYCLTKDVFFQLQQETRDSKFVLKNLIRDTSEAKINNGIRFLHFDLIDKGAFAIGGVSIKKLISHPSFAITQIADISEARDRSKIEIGFRCLDLSHYILGGTMTFAPPLNWALMGYDVEVSGKQAGMTMGFPKGTRLQGNVVCVRWPSGHVFPQSGEFRFVPPTQPHGPEPLKSFKVDNVDFVAVSDSQFKFSAFGLPDSALEPPRINSRHYQALLFVGISLLCFILGSVLLLILKKRIAHDP